MNPARWLYRVRQFWHALIARPTPQDLAHVQEILSSEQNRLFLRLQLSEQAHAILVLKRLEARGQTHADLLVAALLHDVGKLHHRLMLWERAIIVLGRALFPDRAKLWGAGAARGWRRPFVIACQHPVWGADIAGAAGTTDLALEIIRRHQDKLAAAETLEEKLILHLQAEDEAS